jgi:hypothetical protein
LVPGLGAGPKLYGKLKCRRLISVTCSPVTVVSFGNDRFLFGTAFFELLSRLTFRSNLKTNFDIERPALWIQLRPGAFAPPLCSCWILMSNVSVVMRRWRERPNSSNEILRSVFLFISAIAVSKAL